METLTDDERDHFERLSDQLQQEKLIVFVIVTIIKKSHSGDLSEWDF